MISDAATRHLGATEGMAEAVHGSARPPLTDVRIPQLDYSGLEWYTAVWVSLACAFL